MNDLTDTALFKLARCFERIIPEHYLTYKLVTRHIICRHPITRINRIVSIIAHNKVAVLRHYKASAIIVLVFLRNKIVTKLKGFTVCTGNINRTVQNVYLFTGQADNSLYKVFLFVIGILENCNIKSFGVVKGLCKSACNNSVALLNCV